MTRFMLDSSFIIDYLAGHLPARWWLAKRYEGGDELFVSEIVYCEVFAGAKNEREVLAVFEPIEFIQPGPEAAVAAGRWRKSALDSGRSLSLADALIAAAAQSVGAAVLTRNLKDFALTPARVETY